MDWHCSCGSKVCWWFLDRHNFCQHRSCVVVAGLCSLIGQNVESTSSCPAWLKYIVKSRFLLRNPGLRTTGLSPTSSIHIIYLFWGHAIGAYESFTSYDNIKRSGGPLRFENSNHLFSTSHSVHGVIMSGSGYPFFTHLFHTDYFVDNSVDCTVWKVTAIVQSYFLNWDMGVICMPHVLDGINNHGRF